MLFVKKGSKNLSVIMVVMSLSLLMIIGIFQSSVYAYDGEISTNIEDKAVIEIKGNKVSLSTEANVDISGDSNDVVFILEDTSIDADGNVTAIIGYENNTTEDIEITNIKFNDNVTANITPKVLQKGSVEGAYEVIFKGDNTTFNIEGSSNLNIQLIITAYGKIGIANLDKTEKETSNAKEDNTDSTNVEDQESSKEDTTTTSPNDSTSSEEENSPNSQRETLPQTGEDSKIGSYVLGGLFAAAGLLMLVLSKRNRV